MYSKDFGFFISLGFPILGDIQQIDYISTISPYSFVLTRPSEGTQQCETHVKRESGRVKKKGKKGDTGGGSEWGYISRPPPDVSHNIFLIL